MGKDINDRAGISRLFYPPEMESTPKRIRTAVAGVKGRCPRPLDDGGIPVKYSREKPDQTI